MSQPSEERDTAALKEVQAQVQKVQSARTSRKGYCAKIPRLWKPDEAADADAGRDSSALTEDEAFISFYFGRFESFVWIVRRDAPVTLSRIAMSAAQLETDVNRLREALDPKATMISDIPAFDVDRASASMTSY